VRGVNSAFSADIVGLQVTGHGPDVRVVTVTGEVDTVTAPQLATVLTAQLAVARLVVVNLDGVQFLGSAGLQALFEANELATQQDRHLRLVCNSPTANLTLDSAGLREHFTFADNVADALNDRF
jgi:anti-sigma B factor antagonist